MGTATIALCFTLDGKTFDSEGKVHVHVHVSNIYTIMIVTFKYFLNSSSRVI